jgi:hypothetical protein
VLEEWRINIPTLANTTMIEATQIAIIVQFLLSVNPFANGGVARADALTVLAVEATSGFPHFLQKFFVSS